MGKVIVTALVENLDDLTDERVGRLTSDQVRRVEVTDALVDSGATGLLMPKRLIAQLGLTPLRSRNAKTVGGTVSMQVYRAARLTIQGRDCISDVTEIGDDLPVLIGQIPLESMDWVIDMPGQKLIGNPAHGGEQMIEAY
jgi:predicted aspartyl protease